MRSFVEMFDELDELENQIREAMKDEVFGDAHLYEELYGTLVGMLIVDHEGILKDAAHTVLERHAKKEVTANE